MNTEVKFPDPVLNPETGKYETHLHVETKVRIDTFALQAIRNDGGVVITGDDGQTRLFRVSEYRHLVDVGDYGLYLKQLSASEWSMFSAFVVIMTVVIPTLYEWFGYQRALQDWRDGKFDKQPESIGAIEYLKKYLIAKKKYPVL